MGEEAEAWYARAMHDLAFRTAVAADAPAIVARAQSAYRGESGARGWTSEARLIPGARTDAAQVGALIARPRSAILLAEGGGELVGCVHVEAAGAIAHLGLLAVDPERQGQGLGRRLVAAAEAHARGVLGAREMHMDVVHSRGELIAWYERLGYRRTGGVGPFPIPNAVLGLPESTDLHFVVLSRALAPEG